MLPNKYLCINHIDACTNQCIMCMFNKRFLVTQRLMIKNHNGVDDLAVIMELKLIQ